MNGTSVIASALGSFGTGLLNMSTQERLLDKQNAFTEYMWNKQNEYNTPVNQRNRLLAAGFNPILALGQGMTGNAQSVGSSSAPSANNFQNPLSPDSVAQSQLISEQSKGQQINNQFLAAKSYSEVLKNFSEVKDNLSSVNQRLADKDLKEEQRKNLEKERDILTYQLEYTLPATLDNITSQTNLYNTQSDVTQKSYTLEDWYKHQDVTLRKAQIDISKSLAKSTIGLQSSESQKYIADSKKLMKDIESITQDVKNKKITNGQAAIKYKYLKHHWETLYGDENQWTAPNMIIENIFDKLPFGTSNNSLYH